jgi:hypothetical protein
MKSAIDRDGVGLNADELGFHDLDFPRSASRIDVA